MKTCVYCLENRNYGIITPCQEFICGNCAELSNREKTQKAINSRLEKCKEAI